MTPPRTVGPDSGPFARLRAEHRHALDALRKFERTLGETSHGDTGMRGERDERAFLSLAGYLAGRFTAHLAVEERVVFPALGENLPELALALEPLREDHATLREMSECLGELLARPDTPRRDEQLRVLGRDLTDLMRLHVRKEERTVLDWGERVLPAAIQLELGERIARALAAAPPPDRQYP